MAARLFLQQNLCQSQLHPEGQNGEGVLQGRDWSRFPEVSYVFQTPTHPHTHTHTHTHTDTHTHMTEVFNFHFPNATASKIAVHVHWHKIQQNSTYPSIETASHPVMQKIRIIGGFLIGYIGRLK